MSTPPTSSFTRWDSQEAIGSVALSSDVVLLIVRGNLGSRWFIALQTVRRAQPPAHGWVPRAQTVLPIEQAASVCALLQRAVESSPSKPER